MHRRARRDSIPAPYLKGHRMNEPDDEGMQLERFRNYLRVLARTRLPRRLQSKLDPSDVVQQCLLDAARDYSQYRGTTEAELQAWLRQILAHLLSHAYRDLHADKRDVDRERSLEKALEASSARISSFLAADQSTPSAQAMRNEQDLQIARAVEGLPVDERDAVILYYFEGKNQEDIAKELGRPSGPSVAGLIRRGVKRLRKTLGEQP